MLLMSRDIKFRVWDKTSDNMLYQDDFERVEIDTKNKMVTLIAEEESDKSHYVLDYEEGIEAEIMQYTGSKDIKGIEVYEGDIIPFHLDSNVKGVVKFGEYTDWNCKRPTQHIGFYVDFTGKHKRINRKDLGYWVEVSYVIGNIYENPELLEGES